MTTSTSNRIGGILFVIAGALFFGAAVLGKQIVFAGCGAMFVAIGTARLVKAKSQRHHRYRAD